MSKDGKEEVTDDSPDIVLKKGEKGPVFTTEYMIKRMLDLSKYDNRKAMKEADNFYEKVIVVNGQILLEDSEYNFLMKQAEDFAGFLTGRMFSPFYAAIEDAEEVGITGKKVEPSEEKK